MKITAFFLFTLLLLSISLSQNPAEIDEETKQRMLSSVSACIKDVGTCDCSIFPEDGRPYCERMTKGALACLADFSSPQCLEIEPTRIMIADKSIKEIIERRLSDYDDKITDCVNNNSTCNCNNFPKSVIEFCENKKKKQTDCLEGYDLSACVELENPRIKIFPDNTPQWIVNLLEPIICPLVKMRQEGMRNFAIQSAMQSVGICFADPYNCDCSSIKYATIRADCQQRSRLMKTCLEYRDCALAGNASECSGIESCYNLTKMPLVPEVTPGFLKPLIEPIVLKNVCPMMAKWPYDKGNYRRCGS